MTAKIETVKFNFEGKIQEWETEKGVLLEGNKVLVTGDCVAVYEAEPTADPNVFIVDVDKGANNLIGRNTGAVIDIIEKLIA